MALDAIIATMDTGKGYKDVIEMDKTDTNQSLLENYLDAMIVIGDSRV